jgi:Icc protein
VRLAWLTDIHLDWLDEDARRDFAADVSLTDADGVVVTGDITIATTLAAHLDELAMIVSRPVWFVLGNHDCYGGSIAGSRAVARDLTGRHEYLRWLPAAGPIDLGDGVWLVGHDGWGDARLGRLDTDTVLTDFHVIEELRGAHPARLERLRALGDDAAIALGGHLAEASARARHVIVATHVPPFREACWHEGAISDDDWLPYYTCDAVGAALRRAAAAAPGVAFTVLCGHSHGAGTARILANLTCRTGGAEYGEPVVQDVLDTAALP